MARSPIESGRRRLIRCEDENNVNDRMSESIGIDWFRSTTRTDTAADTIDETAAAADLVLVSSLRFTFLLPHSIYKCESQSITIVWVETSLVRALSVCVCVCTRTGRISLDIVCVPSGKHTHTHKVGNWRKSQSRAGQLWIEWKETRPTSITTCHQRAEGDRLITGGSRTPQLKATATT